MLMKHKIIIIITIFQSITDHANMMIRRSAGINMETVLVLTQTVT